MYSLARVWKDCHIRGYSILGPQEQIEEFIVIYVLDSVLLVFVIYPVFVQ